MQIKTRLRFYLIPFTIAKINKKKIMTAHAGENMEKGNTHPLLLGVQTHTVTLGISVADSQEESNLRSNLRSSLHISWAYTLRTFQPTTEHLLNQVQWCSIYNRQKLEKLWYPLTDEWIKKMYIYSRRLLSNFKKSWNSQVNQWK